MKRLKMIGWVALLLLGIVACKKEPIAEWKQTGKIKVVYPAGIDILEITADSLYFTNRSTGRQAVIKFGAAIELENGLYDCAFRAEADYRSDGSVKHGVIYGLTTSVEILDEAPAFTIETHLLESKGDFLIEEIFFTGTLYPTGKQYHGDSYIKIYNPTDRVLYADRIAILESKFLSTIKWDYKPDIRQDTMTVHAIYVIPGSGTDHPVQPGESLLICDTGIDHRKTNANSIDLSAADFEWYDVSNSPSNMDIDSETVPNLDKWYCYTNSFFVLHNRGFRSYAIARIPDYISKESYLNDFFYTYTYVMHIEAGDFPMEQEAYKIPNSWIVDGVNCSVETEWLWNVLPPSVDAGWTHCGTMDHDKTRYFKSVRRKMTSLDENNRRVLKDTNNSTDDFNTECVPSVVEEQGAAIDANGTPATQRTYDGVQPVQSDEI